jgi:UDP-glucose 4-epimerase
VIPVSVLITGGAGYIGSQLIRDLPFNKDFEGRTIRILDNMLRERYVSIMNLPSDVRYEFIEGDIRKDKDLKAAFRDVEVVFDLAGITNAPLSFERKELTMDINYEGWKKILTYAIRNRVKFVYASSASVYGPTEGMVDENFDCKPASPYGETKLLAERECIKACKESGLNATALRLGTVYGYSIGMRFDTVVDRFVYLACIGMPLTVWIGAERAKRPYLHVKDAGRGLMFAATDKRTKGEVYNVV